MGSGETIGVTIGGVGTLGAGIKICGGVASRFGVCSLGGEGVGERYFSTFFATADLALISLISFRRQEWRPVPNPTPTFAIFP